MFACDIGLKGGSAFPRTGTAMASDCCLKSLAGNGLFLWQLFTQVTMNISMNSLHIFVLIFH